MRILCTGAAGFVGFHLANELEANGHEVVRSDQTGQGMDVKVDLAARGAAVALMKEAQPDYVAHLAARYGRILCRDEPYLSVADNTAATTELAAICDRLEVPVLYASSSEVYGDHGTGTITEGSPLLVPTTIYGLSKRWGEEVLELYKVKRCVVRMNMLYGPYQLGGYGRCSLATWIMNAVAGEPYIVHADTTRSWLYIADAVKALRLLIEGGNRGVFNLGNPAPPTRMSEVSRMVQEVIPGAREHRTLPPAGQIAHKNYDVSKLQAALPYWQPEVSLRTGIIATSTWAKGEHAYDNETAEQAA